MNNDVRAGRNLIIGLFVLIMPFVVYHMYILPKQEIEEMHVRWAREDRDRSVEAEKQNAENIRQRRMFGRMHVECLHWDYSCMKKIAIEERKQ